MARSFHSGSPSDAMVFPSSGEGSWGAVQARRSTWPVQPVNAGATAADTDLDNAQLELALKGAQLALVEEDIALLRANRQVSGTSEALLVEDLAEVADWMHGEMKDLLFRRVELNMEVAEQERLVASLEKKAAAEKPRGAFFWEVSGLEVSNEAVRTQVVEWGGGQQWSPQDMLSLSSASGTPQLTWHQRAMVNWTCPPRERPSPSWFTTRHMEDCSNGPTQSPCPCWPMADSSRLKVCRQTGSRSRSDSEWPGTYWTLTEMEVGPHWDRNVPLGQESLPAIVRHFSVPKQSAVVNMRIAVPRPSMPVAAAEQALLMIDGRPSGKVWLTESGDSLLIDAGVCGIGP